MTTATISSIKPAALTARPAAARQRTERLALAAACLLGAITVVAVLLTTAGTLGFPTKAAAMFACGACALALTIYRPVLFPFVAFAALIPFDTLLQTGGGTITKFVAVATAGTLLLVMIDRRRTVTPSIAAVAWFGFIAWSVMSLMWSLDPAFGVSTLLQVAELFALFLIVSMLRVTIAECSRLMAASLAGGIACSLFGLYLYFSGHVVHEDKVSQRVSLSITPGTAINADHFAGALVFPMTIALVAFLRSSGWRKVLSALAFAVMAGGLLASGTRGSLVALGIVCVYVALVERQRLQLILIGAGTMLLSIAIPSVWQRFFSPDQGDLGGRSGIWAIAGEAFRQHWLVGAGTGDFRIAYGQAYIRVAQNSATAHRWFEDSHNLFASTGVELGVIGVVLVLVAWFVQFRIARKVPRLEPFGAYRTIVEASVIGLFVVALSVDVMWYKYVWIVFIMGALVRSAWIAETDRRHALDKAPG